MDDKTKTGAADRSRINVHEDYELSYWTRTLGQSAERLKHIITIVGDRSDDVREYIATHSSHSSR